MIRKTIFGLGVVVGVFLIWVYPLGGAQIGPKAASAKTVEYTSQNLRDPFLSPFEMEAREIEGPQVGAGVSHIQVQGMVWGSKMPQAIINNTVVRTGEVIEGAEILDIRKEGVYILYEGRQYILKPALKKK